MADTTVVDAITQVHGGIDILRKFLQKVQATGSCGKQKADSTEALRYLSQAETRFEEAMYTYFFVK